MDVASALAAHRLHLVTAFRGGQWTAVASDYGAAGSSPLDQLESALRAVESWGRRLTTDPELIRHLDGFVEETLDEVSPKTGATAGLAMIFANATANTGWWAGQYSTATSRVARCQGCGASQQRVLHFTCEYCDQPLYPETLISKDTP